MNKLVKSICMIAFATLTLGIASTIVSCSKNDQSFITDVSPTKERLMMPYMDMVGNVNFDTVEITTVSKAESEKYINHYLDNFITKAFIACGLNEFCSDSIDIYLIPYASHYASSFKSKFNAVQNGAKFKDFHDKDKEKVKKWADKQVEEGYIVVYYYDEKKAEYYALAYTKIEWALLFVK